jgi:hypothetical protein
MKTAVSLSFALLLLVFFGIISTSTSAFPSNLRALKRVETRTLYHGPFRDNSRVLAWSQLIVPSTAPSMSPSLSPSSHSSTTPSNSPTTPLNVTNLSNAATEATSSSITDNSQQQDDQDSVREMSLFQLCAAVIFVGSILGVGMTLIPRRFRGDNTQEDFQSTLSSVRTLPRTFSHSLEV